MIIDYDCLDYDCLDCDLYDFCDSNDMCLGPFSCDLNDRCLGLWAVIFLICVILMITIF